MTRSLFAHHNRLLQGETENQVLAFAADHKDEGWEACIVKPGYITGPGRQVSAAQAEAAIKMGYPGVPQVEQTACVATMLDAVVNGPVSDTLTNEDLQKIGAGLLRETASS